MVFSKLSHVRMHMRREHMKKKSFKCRKCNKTFLSKRYLKNHLLKKNCHQQISVSNNRKRKAAELLVNKITKRCVDQKIHCEVCDVDIFKRFYTAHLRTNKHKSLTSVLYRSNNIEIIKTAFKSRIQSFKIKNLNENEIIFDNFFKMIKDSIMILIEEHVKIHTAVKVNIELFCMYELCKNEEIKTDIKSFNTKYEIISQSTSIDENCAKWFNTIKTKSDEFNEQESGWSLLQILHLEVNINKYNPLRASGFCKVPKNISKKNAVVNVLSDDGRCFAYSIMSALFPTRSAVNNICDYPDYRAHLNFEGITFPMEFNKISKFENQNNMSINVFGLNQSNTKIVGPLHHTKNRREHHINLLYYVYRKKTHFVWIKNLSRLVRSQLTKHKCQIYICDGCLLYFPTNEKLRSHQTEQCHKIKITLPTPGESNYSKNLFFFFLLIILFIFQIQN